MARLETSRSSVSFTSFTVSGRYVLTFPERHIGGRDLMQDPSHTLSVMLSCAHVSCGRHHQSSLCSRVHLPNSPSMIVRSVDAESTAICELPLS